MQAVSRTSHSKLSSHIGTGTLNEIDSSTDLKMTLTRTTTRAPTDDKHASMPISELVDGELAYQSLIDPGKTWYNNARYLIRALTEIGLTLCPRLAKLTVYIVILYVLPYL